MNNQDFETTIHSKRDSVFLDYYTGDLDTNRMYIWGVPVDRENWRLSNGRGDGDRNFGQKISSKDESSAARY